MKANQNSVFSDEPNRRRFMAGATGLYHDCGNERASGRGCAEHGSSRGAPRRVDFHHHFIPPRHLEAILAQRESGRTPAWSPEMSLAEMDKNGIATSNHVTRTAGRMAWRRREFRSSRAIATSTEQRW